ncbi:MAG: hypothetical protein H6555_06100 [Lewinellaceae bacterium]|nr:hypothetical protein [Lewinellaceae bacterium]
MSRHSPNSAKALPFDIVLAFVVFLICILYSLVGDHQGVIPNLAGLGW